MSYKLKQNAFIFLSFLQSFEFCTFPLQTDLFFSELINMQYSNTFIKYLLWINEVKVWILSMKDCWNEINIFIMWNLPQLNLRIFFTLNQRIVWLGREPLEFSIYLWYLSNFSLVQDSLIEKMWEGSWSWLVLKYQLGIRLIYLRNGRPVIMYIARNNLRMFRL